MKNDPQVICFGEVLWDVVGSSRHIGGAPLNVCYHLTQHGYDCRMISQVGHDQKGGELLSGISQLGVDTSLISVTDQYPTSEVPVQVSGDGKVSYTILENVAWDAIPFDEAKAMLVAKASYFVFGSLACRSRVTRDTLLRYLGFAKWKVLDLNLRSPHYDSMLIRDLLSYADTLKLNDDELAIIGTQLGARDQDPSGAIQQVFRQYPRIKEIILTMGADGAQYFSADLQLRVPARKVEVVDTVGSGDAFLAAFLAGKLQQKPIQECMNDAVVLSGFIAGSRGACPVYSVEEVYSA